MKVALCLVFLAASAHAAEPLLEIDVSSAEPSVTRTVSPSSTPSPTLIPTPVAESRARKASREAYEKGLNFENLEAAALEFRRAQHAEPEGPWAAEAGLALGRQEYALGRYETALTLLAALDETKLSAESKPLLLFWRAQSRLVLKGLAKAQEDFESFLKTYPEHPLSDAAALAIADCDAALKNDEAALAGYQKLYQVPPSSVAPQALFQAAQLLLRAQKLNDGRQLLKRIIDEYPESIEAPRAADGIKQIPEPSATATLQPAKTAVARPRTLKVYFTVQVGAYSQRNSALKLVKHLQKAGYPVHLEKRVLQEQIFHLVQVGHYKSRAAAQKAAEKIKSRQKLPARIVELP